MDDRQLIVEYVKNGSEAAFADLTSRYIKLVHATCYRTVCNKELAEDATQVVFLLLARKAPSLARKESLAGWLFHTSRLVSKNAMRLDRGRAVRDQKVVEHVMEIGEQNAAAWRQTSGEWESIDGHLNAALESLGRAEREIILRRFFAEQTLEESGAQMGISPDAARMRVNRAIEKLRQHFAKHGVTMSATVLAGLLGANAVPQAQAATLSAAAIAKIAVGGSVGKVTADAIGANVLHLLQGVQKTMLFTKLATVAAVVAVATGGTFGAYPLITGSHHYKMNGKANVSKSLVKTIANAPQMTDTQLHAASRSRIYKLSLDVFRYMQDHGDTFPVVNDQADLQKVLKPYDSVADNFLQPGANVPYQWNASISGKKLSKDIDPSTDIMLYETIPDKDGSRIVALVCCVPALVKADRWAIYEKTDGMGNAEIQRQSLLDAAAKLEASGFLPKDDFLKLSAFMTAKPGPMSDQELDWLVELLKAPNVGIKRNTFLIQTNILATFGQNTQPTPSQRERIYQTVLPFLQSTDPDDQKYALLRVSAAIVLTQLKDRRAVPHLIPLLNDPHPGVRLKTREALTALGYVVQDPN